MESRIIPEMSWCWNMSINDSSICVANTDSYHIIFTIHVVHVHVFLCPHLKLRCCETYINSTSKIGWVAHQGKDFLMESEVIYEGDADSSLTCHSFTVLLLVTGNMVRMGLKNSEFALTIQSPWKRPEFWERGPKTVGSEAEFIQHSMCNVSNLPLIQ